MNKKVRSLINLPDMIAQFFDNLPAHIYFKDTNFEYLGCNRMQAVDAGLTSPEDIVGKTDYDLYSKTLADKIRKNDMEVLQCGKACVFDENAPDNHSTENPIYLTHKIPLFNSKGETIGLAGISFNITAQRRHEKKLVVAKEAAEITLAAILENLPGHVYWKDQDSVYQGCNLAQAKSAGFLTAAEMIGKTDFEMPWNHEASILRESDLLVMENKTTFTREEASQLANNQHVSIFLSKKAPLINTEGKVIGVLGISFDITDRKEMEKNLNQAKEAAEAANRAKTEFLENMRHDIRTPLTGIVGFSEVLKMEFNDPRIQEYADNLIASSHALLHLLDEVLEAIRVGSGEIPRLKKKFNLEMTLQTIIDLNRAKASQKKLQLTLEVDPAIPRFLLGDKIRFHRVALELIANALNFTDSGYVKLSAQAAGHTERGIIIKLIVKDSGIGIPKDKQEDIYTQFTRLTPSYHGIYKGAGLGLSVIKQFIDDLEGEIYVESESGKGTCFTCLIPLQTPLLDNAEGAEELDDVKESIYMKPLDHFSTPNCTNHLLPAPIGNILLVEDNSIAQQAAKVLLCALNCNVEVAGNGEEAVSLFGQKPYDLILMDIGLGKGMDGYEVTNFIRRQKNNPHIPIIALTAHAGDDQNRQRCIESGMNAVLSKPLTKSDATTLLKAFIPQKHPTPVSPSLGGLDLPDNDEDLFKLTHFPLLDKEAAIKNCGDEKLACELLSLMVSKEELPNDLRAIKTAFSVNDYSLVEKIAHKIKGGAAYVGTTRMKFACQYLERYYKAGETRLFNQLYIQAIDVIAETLHCIEEWLQNNTQGSV